MEIEEAKRRARSGPMLLFARRMFGIGITLLSTITVARLVSPRDYGLANMSVVLFAFGQMFREFGLTSAILRKGNISEEEVSFLFWFNTAMTIIITIALALGAIPIARFYNEPIIASIVWLSVIGFLIDGLSLQHRALMSRELRFGAIALLDSIALFVGFSTTLTIALIRHDVWAIVFGGIAQAAVGSILYVWTSGWRPGPPRRIPELRDLLTFGANSSIFSICMFFADNGASILIGYFIGPAPLGQYTRAQALYKLPNVNLVQPIIQSAMPLMARLRPYPDQYREVYLALVTKLCTFLFPASVALTFAAVPFVQTMLGQKWIEAGLCFMMLAPSLAAYAIGYCAGDLFVTQNRSGELRTVGIIEGIVRVASIFVGVQYGLIATAIAFTLSNSVMALVKVYVAGRKGPVSAGDQFRAAIPAVPLAAGAALGCALVQAWNQYMAMPIPALAFLQMAIAGAMAIAFGLAFPSSRASLYAILDMIGIPRLYSTARNRMGDRHSRG